MRRIPFKCVVSLLTVLVLAVLSGCSSIASKLLDFQGGEDTDQLVEMVTPIIPPTEVVVATATAMPTDIPISDLEVDYTYTEGLITSMYHLYGSVLDNFVNIFITNNGDLEGKVVVQTYIEGYTNEASDTVTIQPGETVEVNQNPRLKAEAVDALNSQMPGTLHILVKELLSNGEKVLLNDTQDVELYSRRDFVWIEDLSVQENYDLQAVFVTPTDPAVEELIRAAADYTDSGQVYNGYGGYENDEAGWVWDRLEAIWQAEDEIYELTYISTMVSFGPNTVQRMRLPAEVLQQKGGNCVELANLYASAAEALLMETAVLHVPGHAYVAVRTDDVNANYYFIETTLIGQASFEDAVNAGGENWAEAQPNLDAGSEEYTWVNIQQTREAGITPIPWK